MWYTDTSDRDDEIDKGNSNGGYSELVLVVIIICVTFGVICIVGMCLLAFVISKKKQHAQIVPNASNDGGEAFKVAPIRGGHSKGVSTVAAVSSTLGIELIQGTPMQSGIQRDESAEELFRELANTVQTPQTPQAEISVEGGQSVQLGQVTEGNAQREGHNHNSINTAGLRTTLGESDDTDDDDIHDAPQIETPV